MGGGGDSNDPSPIVLICYDKYLGHSRIKQNAYDLLMVP